MFGYFKNVFFYFSLFDRNVIVDSYMLELDNWMFLCVIGKLYILYVVF